MCDGILGRAHSRYCARLDTERMCGAWHTVNNAVRRHADAFETITPLQAKALYIFKTPVNSLA